ncbi:hypothetical protein [Virgibacillus salexigens]|uniref:Uncharacterized protein n=1 Tax=Virgibacillus kapii TaxID=1638645 RepID=A0ABQ2DL12_9BACI|nr:hypothetical protein [Virgibacillus kapii]GGJ62143.1 hypothetical protein GCM10007111_25340 [Virgibacillus kapii]
MKIKDVTKKHQSQKNLIFQSWEDSEIKFYKSKKYFFIYEKSKYGQILSVSTSSTKMTDDERAHVIRKIMRLSPEDVYIYHGPTGVLYIRKKDEVFLKVANSDY